ncbi:hypothetical protein OU994_07990 [Pseudoduganella sp. SL102]|uniref:hypothetical protein n=1 Tax=Pseudoduganella sp. SL102 TaxID=2995154 RepID=UPI00248B45D6|nr:hypothetical protein [Pseudoduganella sp. SL102]WBS04212.1 hypothetical protein OU994_07990 [Pseudoduganella sp. SL102]
MDLVIGTVSNGELLIFSVSFASPIFLAAMQDRGGKSPFPGAIWHIFTLIGFAIGAAAVFGLLKIEALVPEIKLGLNMDAIRTLSYYIFAAALLLRYTTMVYQKMLSAADASGPKQDKDFADRWAAHAEDKENKGR